MSKLLELRAVEGPGFKSNILFKNNIMESPQYMAYFTDPYFHFSVQGSITGANAPPV